MTESNKKPDKSTCCHYGIIDIGFSDLYWCKDCEQNVLKIEDKTMASGYRMEVKEHKS